MLQKSKLGEEGEENMIFYTAKRDSMCCTTIPFLLNIHAYITTAVYKESDKNEHLL